MCNYSNNNLYVPNRFEVTKYFFLLLAIIANTDRWAIILWERLQTMLDYF